MPRGVIDLIEGAYRIDLALDAWLENLAAALPRRPKSIGVSCYTYEIIDWRVSIGRMVDLGMHVAVSEVTLNVVTTLPAEYVRETWATLPCEAALLSGAAATRAETRARMAQMYEPLGIKDIAVLNGLDPTHHGIFLGEMCGRTLSLSRRERVLGNRIAAHLAAAYRLRRGAPCEEAVVTPAGTIEHAVDAATSGEARSALRDAVLAIERARSLRSDPDEALEQWHALVAGRWTLVDRVDSDRRRYYIACKNDPELARHHALTPRERQAVGYAALGHSNTLIGYELGLSPSTVAQLLSTAADKLGVGSRAALIQAARAFSPASVGS